MKECTPLSWAAKDGRVGTMQILLPGGADPDLADKDGRTPLSWAAGDGHTVAMEVLLSSEKHKTADPNIPDKDGRTPLSRAAGNGHAEAVTLFLRLECAREGQHDDPELVDDNSPISWASKNGHNDVLRILIEAQLSERIRRGLTYLPPSYYLHKAAEHGWATVTKLFIENRLAVDTPDPDNDDYTPLCVAAQHGRAEVVQLLLQAAANPNYRTSKARDTPLTLAFAHRREAVVKALLEARADITLSNAMGENSRSLALRVGHANIFNMIAAVDREGSLAETAKAPYLVPSVDCRFQTTVVHFIPRPGAVKSSAVKLDVGSLLKAPIPRPRGARDVMWLHLPATNVSLMCTTRNQQWPVPLSTSADSLCADAMGRGKHS